MSVLKRKHNFASMADFGKRIKGAKPIIGKGGIKIYPEHGKKLNKERTKLIPRDWRKDRESEKQTPPKK